MNNCYIYIYSRPVRDLGAGVYLIRPLQVSHVIVHWIQFCLVATYKDIATTGGRPFEVLVSSIPCWAFEYTQGWVLSDPQGKRCYPPKMSQYYNKNYRSGTKRELLTCKVCFFACSLWSTRDI